MTETERINDGFMYLFSKLGTPANDRDNPNSKEGTELDVRRVLNRLYEIGFADRKENIQRTMGSNGTVYDYWINSKGLHFIDTLPKEFEKLPYSYYLELEKDEKALKKTRDDLDEKVKNITLGNIRTNKFIAPISLIVAICSLLFTALYKNKKEDINVNIVPPQPQIEQELQRHRKDIENIRYNQDSLINILKTLSKYIDTTALKENQVDNKNSKAKK